MATCILPSGRAKVVSAPVTPAPGVRVSSDSTVNGGHFAAQASVQALVLAVSAANV